VRASYRKIQFALDAGTCVAAFVIAYLLRFDFDLNARTLALMLPQLPLVVLAQLVALYLSGAQGRVWRYTSMRDLPAFARAFTYSTGVILLVRVAPLVDLRALRVPLSIILMDTILAFTGVLGVRLLRRALDERTAGKGSAAPRRAVLVGAGRAGALTVREMADNLGIVGCLPVAFVDDDPLKLGNAIGGVRVAGRIDDLPRVIKGFGAEEVVLTIADIQPTVRRKVDACCRELGVPLREVPGYYELLQGSVSFTRLRTVSTADLLGRDPIQLDQARLRPLLAGKRILVTGAGGSIGSELARQVMHFRPAKLGLLERAEHALFEIDRECRALDATVDVEPVLADCSIQSRMRTVLADFAPDVIIHAAAHKHVPMMEMYPGEAIRNNAAGTMGLGCLAAELGVGRFILVSTDKAVHPTSVMGASKRLAEIAVEYLSGRSKTVFSAVRFGNVLGSAGSVIPLFRQQIKAGGPVTVTDVAMERYFMSIPEAAQLVLQAGAMAEGGEIFVLDMGEPIKIIDLARNMITLSGYEPEVDIPIEITGRRRGEKLFEELGSDTEELSKTRHPKIFIGKLHDFPEEKFLEGLAHLQRLSQNADGEAVRRYLQELLPHAQLDLEPLTREHAE
jgi:FlaA1/EpsC-like NDP-sugar epimerase